MISNRRVMTLAVLLAVGILVVIVRSAQIQILESALLSELGAYQQTLTHISPAPRGDIYDRNGNLLATSRLAYMIRVNRRITDTAMVADIVARSARQPMDEVFHELDIIARDTQVATPTMSHLLMAGVSPSATFQITSALQAASRGGIDIEATWERVYPQAAIAGPALGFVNLQPHGYSGVEGFYNNQLRSEKGVRKERTQMELLSITPTVPGSELVLTLDLALQSYAEKRLAQAMREYTATAGTIIVMETRTGAILASVSAPGYDPNDALNIANSSDFQRLRDPAVSDPYEPGSVIKVATVAAAIEAGIITTRTIYTDTGRFEVSGKVIRNSDQSGHGRVDIEDMLVLSLNVVAVQVAFDTGADKIYRTFQLFGFGRKTGIDLENEVAGVLRTPADVEWSKADLATNSYGQGMTATPYQVINAVNAIANDGVLLQPFMLRQWRSPNGEVVTRQPTDIQRVVSPETARQVRSVMASATRLGLPGALPKGYSVAGKTGTADWYLRGLKQDTTIVTFVGFLPASDPQLTILIKFDEPKLSRWAAQTTTPVFKDVAQFACRVLGIAPDMPIANP